MEGRTESRDIENKLYILLNRKPAQRSLARGETLLWDSGKGVFCYCLVQGRLAVEVLTADGKRIRVDILEQGDFFVPEQYLLGYNLQCQGFVLENLIYFSLKREELQELLLQPDVALGFWQKSCLSMQRAYGQFLIRSLFSPKAIVADYILQHENSDYFVYSSLYELSGILGISRRGLYNVLHELEQQGLLLKHGRQYKVVDCQGLRHLAASIRAGNFKGK